MSQKTNTKPFWEMNLEELREATKEFDEEFVIEKSRPLTPKERAQWERVRAKLVAERRRNGERVIAVRLEQKLLDRCTALAKKKRISSDALIVRGLNAVLAAEGEED